MRYVRPDTAEEAAVDFMRDYAGEVGDWVLGVTKEPGKTTTEIAVVEADDEMGYSLKSFWAKSPNA